MRKVKCQICGKWLTNDTAYKITVNGKNQYYCTKEEYEHMKKEQETKEECYKYAEELINLPYSIKGFIKAVEDAILAEYGGDTKAVEKAKEEQTKDLEERVDRFIDNLDKPEEEEPKLNKVEAVNTIKANISKLNFADVQNTMKKYGFANFNNPDEIPEEGLLEILKMIK